MSNINITEVIAITREAGKAIMEIYNQANEVASETKVSEVDGFESPLTQADIESHKIITAKLKELTPDIPIVSEEQNQDLNLEAMKNPLAWVVDPIDGTKGFIKRDGDFTINIGLVKNDTPVAGVVFAPVHELMFYADKNGAFVEENSQTRSISASSSTVVKNVVASKNHLDETTSTFLEQFGEVNFVQAGSSLKLCKVATGEADVYPRLGPNSMEWDTAAADAIVRCAGGIVIGPDGQPLAYGKAPELRNLGFVAHGPNVEYRL